MLPLDCWDLPTRAIVLSVDEKSQIQALAAGAGFGFGSYLPATLR